MNHLYGPEGADVTYGARGGGDREEGIRNEQSEEGREGGAQGMEERGMVREKREFEVRQARIVLLGRKTV